MRLVAQPTGLLLGHNCYLAHNISATKGSLALDLVNNPCYHQRSKHIQARYHFVRDGVHVEKEIEVEKIPSRQMGADMLTKHASVGVVCYNKKPLGMQ